MEADRLAVEEHVSRVYGKVDYVLHAPVSADDRHIDVHIILPRPGDPNYTLFTTGMSDRAMAAPDGQPAFAELMIRLPADWSPLPIQELSADAPEYWPIHALKFLARFPEEYKTWIGHGHTIPNGDPPQPLVDGSAYTCMFVCDPPDADRGFGKVSLEDGRWIQIYAVLPITTPEMNLCIDRGENEMLAALSDAGVGYIFIAHRNSVVPLP
ncbi:MAG: suppressor of fused domain protein [Spirochaetales bacterium]|nr:suppressor of fused domain protein [Spirochaetales bacterium]